jgi:hypothetical protein
VLPVLGWKIFRADGSVWSSAEYSVWEVPDEIQAIVLYHAPPFRTMELGEDFYSLDGRMLAGKWMDTAAYYALVNQAFLDEVWP